MAFTGKQLTTQLDADGTLTVQLNDKTWDDPKPGQVLIKVEATPINPSDLGLLFASADTDNAVYTPGKVVAKMPEAATRAFKARHGMAMPAGNEAAGIVVAAGEGCEHLMGKRVACVPVRPMAPMPSPKHKWPSRLMIMLPPNRPPALSSTR